MARIDALFDALVARGASDLHICAGKPPMMRVRGELVALRASDASASEVNAWLLEILDDHQRAELRDDYDLDFAYRHEAARFRASYFQKTTGLGAVFRTIPKTIPTLEELSAPKVIRKICEQRQGLVLVTGPTGSGKSTTLAAMIRAINESRGGHILTIEDPIEFVHEPIKARITQREIGVHAPDFPTAMMGAGREDANVILVGELRGVETMSAALELASFGVLVFGTIHTNSAPSTIDRFINAFPSEDQDMARSVLSDVLVGVISQQLLPSADGKGRTAALEILLGSSALSTLIRDKKSHQIPNIMQASKAQGMQTLDMALVDLVFANRIKPETAIERAHDREAVIRGLKR